MSNRHFEQLTERIEQRSAHTVVIGLGYVGLPFALLHARSGYEVTGIERNPVRVDAVNAGTSYIEDVEDSALGAVVKAGQLTATSAFEPIAGADIVSICVPTPLTAQRVPDVSYIERTLEHAREHWHAGQLVIVESTTYPGATEEILVPFFTALGLTPGEEIFIAFAPERIDPGQSAAETADIPRVVGGVTARCTAAAVEFYGQLLEAEVFAVSSPRVAEMTKLFENVFRVVNVSLVNELAQLCDRMEIDVWEVIEAAKTKPFGFMPFYPGPGIGGHCIPVDPFFLAWKAREFGFTTRFIELAGEINDSMPLYIVQQAAELLNEHSKPVRGAKVLLLGVAFKKDVADTRSSAAIAVAERLLVMGADVSYHDPLVASTNLGGHECHSQELTPELLRDTDLVVVTTDHSAVDYALVAEAAPLIYDTRNALAGRSAPNLRRLGAPD